MFILGTVSCFATQANKGTGKRQILSLLLAFLFVGVSFYNIFAITPTIINMAEHGARKTDKAFSQQHTISRSLMITESALATVILILLI